jgi:hypothetical protein
MMGWLCRHCRRIDQLVPEAWTNPFGHVLISRLHPDTDIALHSGGTNLHLTMHCPLVLPAGTCIMY